MGPLDERGSDVSFLGRAYEEEVKGDTESDRGIGTLRGILGLKGNQFCETL